MEIEEIQQRAKDFIQGLIKGNVQNSKGEDMVQNEKVDKRDIIREIMAIAGKEEASEDVKTIAKLAEKLAYDESEDGTADNKKAKNEDEEKEEKFEEEKEIAENKKAKNEDEEEKEDEEEAENKCKNSMDDIKKLVYGGKTIENANYIPKSKRLELGNQY